MTPDETTAVMARQLKALMREEHAPQEVKAMTTTSILIAARELAEAAARFDILHETDGARYVHAKERFERAKKSVAELITPLPSVGDDAKRAA